MASFDPKTKVWEAKKVPYPYDMDVYLGEVILKACNETPDRIIQIHHEKKELLTCRNLKESSINIAENLMALGIKPDDVIGVLCHNSNFLTCFLAGSVITGAIVHPLDHSLNATNIGQLYAQSIPKMIICDPEMVGTLEEALAIANLKPMILITSDDSENDESKYSSVNLLLEPITAKYDAFKTPKFDKPADEKILAILCSSGITGLQKNVCVSHATCLQFDFKTYPKPPSKPLTFSSAYWSSGFFFHVLAPFYTDDVRLWSSDDFNIFKLIEIVETHKISDLNLAPSSLAAILSSDQFLKSEHTSLKRFVVIGSMLTESLRNKFRKIFPDKILMTEYGMTEVLVSLSKPDEIYNGITVGSMIAPNLTLKIVNEDGESVNPVERGEIRVKMQFQFLGYYKDPEATKNALDSEGFFKTGDIGYFDEDGCLYILDRIKESFKYKNYVIFPSEIEDVVQAIDGVEIACVFPKYSESLGTDLAAVAVKRPLGKNLSEEEIIKTVADVLPEVKQIYGGVYFVDDMPLTPSGKVQRRVLQETVMNEN